MAQLQVDIASGNEIKNVDFGEGDWLYALWGSCWHYTQPTGEMYTYEVCAFKQAKQGSTLLGNYERLGINTANAEVIRLDEINDRHPPAPYYDNIHILEFFLNYPFEIVV